jgi:hypothetical protein
MTSGLAFIVMDLSILLVEGRKNDTSTNNAASDNNKTRIILRAFM